MKTIITTLPIYDKLAKQCYERARHTLQPTDSPVPVVCPRHRLPSFQWLDGTDGADHVDRIEMIGASAVDTVLATNWDDATNTYDTLTHVGLNINSAIATAAAYIRTQTITLSPGQQVRIIGTLNVTGGLTPTLIFSGGIFSQNTTLSAGANDIVFTNFSDNTSSVLITIYVAGASTFTFTGVEISTLDNYYDITSYFSSLPASHSITTDVYFTYEGDTLKYPLPLGNFYLKITTDNGFVYYSEWFLVDCVFPNLVNNWTNVSYEGFTSLGSQITGASETGVSGIAASNNSLLFFKGEVITVICYLQVDTGVAPYIAIYSGVSTLISNQVQLVAGLNIISLTTTDASDDAFFRIYNTAAGVFRTTDILINRLNSEDYLILNFHNDCDIGDILYHDGFTQTVWFKSEPMEMTFPQEEEGIKNGEGKFIRTFARQTKKYLVKTLSMPDYMVEVFNRMKLHDTVELINLVGDTNDVYNLEVDHEWIDEGKYYAKIELTLDYDETFVIAGCCNNL
jgi:hypothetical protein